MSRPSMKPSMPRAHARAGYTLVELMVVIAIIVILSAIGLFSIRKPNVRVASQGLAREIYALASNARLAAATSGRQVCIRIQGGNPAAQLFTAPVTGNQALNWTNLQNQPHDWLSGNATLDAVVNGFSESQVL